MLLENKTAVIYGAGGVLGGAVARAFAREHAYVFLAGRALATLDTVAQQIADAGGVAETAEVDALDERAVRAHADDVAAWTGGIDISINTIGLPHVQGVPLVELSPEDFTGPMLGYTMTQFLTARAAAHHMISQRSGVILTLSGVTTDPPDGYRGGLGVACGAIQALSRQLSEELGQFGIRVACLRPKMISYTPALGPEQRMAGSLSGFGEPSTPADIADAIAFLASDQTAPMVGAIANLTCGTPVRWTSSS